MIRTFLFTLFLVASFGAVADDVPPMPPEVRARFNAAMSKLWHADCECWRFTFEGRIKEVHAPLDDKARWAILRVIEDGAAIPIAPTGQGS
ncbi:MAG: hypothetical protein RH946_18160 [Rhodospirillales bacterium]